MNLHEIYNSKRNWTEDFKMENGNYINGCRQCGEEFLGHKHRVLCKECSDKYDND